MVQVFGVESPAAMVKRVLAYLALAAVIQMISSQGWSQSKAAGPIVDPYEAKVVAKDTAVPQPAVIYTKDNTHPAPKIGELALKQSLSQYGITWTFDRPVRTGQFVNGDWYVVGPVTVK